MIIVQFFIFDSSSAYGGGSYHILLKFNTHIYFLICSLNYVQTVGQSKI